VATVWRQAREDAMNHSMYSADRTSHIKIVLLALLAATVVAAVSIFARVSEDPAQITKATQLVTVSGHSPAIW
jgi:hypothetical protein